MAASARDVDLNTAFAKFEGKTPNLRGVAKAIKKAMEASVPALAFNPDDATEFSRIDAMAQRPRGRPTDEEKKALAAQKAARVTLFAAIRTRLGLEKSSWSDKKLTKALSAFAAAAGGKSGGDGKSRAVISLEPPSGTRDFYPNDLAIRNWLFGHFRRAARLFGFQEYDAPVLESAELYKRKAGEEITQQMYNFTDKEGAEVTLRPEMTPSLARMVLKRADDRGEVRDLLPFKWFSIPQCWRFETTQRGRKREHFQWNMDIVGVKSATAELELLAAIVTFFKNVGITAKDVEIKINSRKVLGSIIEAAGIPRDKFAPVCVVIDKLDKIQAEGVLIELDQLGIPKESSEAILKAMKCCNVEQLAKLCEGKVDPEAIDEMRRLFSDAKAYGIADYLTFDASIVRGLAYYTGIVFECFDRKKVLRAVCGGGRYDRLLSLYGSAREIPCVGFGFGDCVIMELFKELKLMDRIIQETSRCVDFVVAPYDKKLFSAACSVAARLRGAGFSVDLVQEPSKKVKNSFSYADRAGARQIVFVAPDEWAEGLVVLKDLRSGDAAVSKTGQKDKGQKLSIDQVIEAGRKIAGAKST